MPIEKNDINAKSKGGTELMMARLEAAVDPAVLDKFQIFFSRIRVPLKSDLIKVFYCHDLPEDGESAFMANGGWRKFDYLVFVSYWQRQRYVDFYKIDLSRTMVIRNAIEPIAIQSKPDPSEQINIIYHTLLS